ncbi:MAG TPA: glycosyltransferase [Myxococcales bacterium]|nr:glycosyltransferase [Myxococcales bacterium]
MSDPVISVITVVYNAADTIADTLGSVASQTYSNIEYIVVDGGSSDGTLAVIEKYRDVITHFVSEPDAGIYDAMNKGIGLATGDVVGFLNADDIFADAGVLGRVALAMQNTSLQACFGDVVFVGDDMETAVRYYRSSGFSPGRLAYGWMPAHPSLYLRRDLFDRYGNFRTDYEIAADYELVARLFGKHRISYVYLPWVFVNMRLGGVSTKGLRNSFILNREIVRACEENSISTNMFKVLLKIPSKLSEFFIRR